MTQTIQYSVIQINEVEARFGLQEIVENQFFREWQDISAWLGFLHETAFYS